MLCTRDVKWKQRQNHKNIALELAFTTAIASTEDVRSSAILINKYKRISNNINDVFGKYIHFWSIDNEEMIHIGGNVLLCHFDIMKAWSKKSIFLCFCYWQR